MTQTVYLVVGASRGIGLALATKLSENPDNYVIASYRSATTASKLLELAKKPNVDTVVVDIADEDCKEQLEKGLAKLTDGLDVAIINAGISKSTLPILECSRELFMEHFLTNTIGALEAYKAAHGFLLKRNTRKVVFTSSNAGSIGTYLPLPVGAYGTSKAALNFVIRRLSDENAGENFSYVGVHPGLVVTDMAKGLMEKMENSPTDPMALAFSEYLKNHGITAETSAEGIVTTISMLSPHTSGRLVRVDDQTDFPF
ncbi:hypothetical protein KL905_004815 [Ogataea polymorpha]|uniref:Uncharacterized protein n=1 Tax=Ogataea polymorpha TaxID=460523 RepID=A0A1B7SDR2_9ASCO|nr:uncharacterized protein OGAPODRAFT_10094 [Ogataea polymorpha]KAG7877598.1 hypothetical protein KL937_004793 [Ogataea polymorpha]KAG7887005.1 hypothetical protein KL936_004856 [Ogataea polymorpha]KAG7889072.1 hypothetical protein KL908_004872 [Ogataea polymorpha]KAG7897937.1 hypothetical protein KL935_004812 [Ogataea polymorpha]KAG7899991.1 hypothetical protein KL907_004753 [Ogataea polymorpha]